MPDERVVDSPDICVISAVNDRQILATCLAHSPDIANGSIELVTIENARSMPLAYNDGLRRTSANICVFAHQDVYLPRGWLARFRQALAALDAHDPKWQVAGPYGVRKDGRHVGRVWDVTMERELGNQGFGIQPVASLDELVLIVRREPGYRFDTALPDFHLYGTDIVQHAWAAGRSAYAVELPVVHNNRPIATLRGGYSRAYSYVRRKWASELPIPTSVCAVSWNPLVLWRTQWRRRHVRERPEELLADAREVAQKAGYE